MPLRALITGITGQDGAYLSRLLLDKGYQVHGIVDAERKSKLTRLVDVVDRLRLHELNLRDERKVTNLVGQIRPREIYNLAAQSFVPLSFEQPIATADVNGLGPVRLLEAIRLVDPTIRFFQASTSEMFSRDAQIANETTPLAPQSPYAAAKAYAHFMTSTYREKYGLFAVSGILFNHESPLRGEQFVTRKITLAAARIKRGEQQVLKLGSLLASRDWGFAGDYVDGMWRMLQHDSPEDFVMATGQLQRVEDFVQLAFAHVGLDWRKHVQLDDQFARADELPGLRGDASKAATLLNWRPRVSFAELVAMMVDADLGPGS